MNEKKPSMYNIHFPLDEEYDFVFNTASGGGVTIERKKISDEANLSRLEDEEIKELIKKNILVPKELNEFEREKYKRNDALYGNHFDTQLYVIAPTLACNARCDYCFQDGKHCCSMMSESTRRKTIQFIKGRIEAHKETQLVSMAFFGGEPTLDAVSVEEISKEVKDFCMNKGIRYSGRIISNGILLNEEMAIRLKDVGVNNCQITLDGLAQSWSEKKHLPIEDYYKVLNNIKSAADVGIKPIVRINVDYKNKDEISELLMLLFEEMELNGKIMVVPAPVMQWNNTENADVLTGAMYEELLVEYRKLALRNNWEKSFDNMTIKVKTTSCGMVSNSSVGIRYDGKLYRCEHCFAESHIAGMNAAIGDLDNGFYYNEIDRAFKEETLPDSGDESLCSQCKFYPLCHGGCRMEKIVHNGPIDCANVKTRYMNRLKYKVAVLAKECGANPFDYLT